MPGRGVLYALSDDDTARLLEAPDDSILTAVVADLKSRWDTEWLCELDKAWDGIHRCLTDGKLEWTNGEYPLSHAILGSQRLYEGDEWFLLYVTPAQVADISWALEGIHDAELRRRYLAIDPDDYEFSEYDDDVDYVAGWFKLMKRFYAKAAADGRPVLMTVDWT